ncbi:hypothetical protein [Litoreibacter ponti]|nr:hypothetical protein [Litoreibacter ponti]
MPASAQEIKARFVIVNAEAGRQVVPQEWSDAVVAAGLGETTATVIDTDFFAIDRTVETAKEDGSTVAFFMTANLPTTDDAQFASILERFLTPNPQQPQLEGLYAMMQEPGCALIRKPLSGQEFIHTNTILTKNDPAARVACFRSVMTYTMNNLDQFGPRTPFHEQVDPGAVERQANLPPMAIKSSALIDPSDPNAAQGPVRRASNVYKPGEKMDFHANILNVGRFDPGTAQARYEIQLDLAVTRKDGGGAQTLPKVFVYTGQSTHRIPVAEDYFDNFITAGFSLQDPGEYLVELVLTDLSRPGQDGTVLRVPYEVVVAE